MLLDLVVETVPSVRVLLNPRIIKLPWSDEKNKKARPGRLGLANPSSEDFTPRRTTILRLHDRHKHHSIYNSTNVVHLDNKYTLNIDTDNLAKPKAQCMTQLQSRSKPTQRSSHSPPPPTPTP